MKARLLIVALGASLLASGCGEFTGFGGERRVSLAQDIMAGWSVGSRAAGAMMMDKYGPPDALARDALGWGERGRWKRIVVRDRGESETAGILEQTVEYYVPEGRRREVEAFSGDVRVSREGTALSSRSDDEALNYLALNLADGIGRGVLDAERARGYYRRAVDLSHAGKASPLMQGFLFVESP
jgi:hypothetical protein